ncbi:hypothetical protein [Baekduia sp.]|jgi:hypothetical protein|uniref:hypothetical protein n=1 Tax=Baekduia sp. TaxID=2600305 RepID=UPI002E0333AD|nr:hypothetical protein [Baekduia sp.]
MPLPPSDAASTESRLSPRILPNATESADARDDTELVEDAVIAARDAALTALRQTLNAKPGLAPEVRVMITATLGNPSTEYSQSEVRFAAPDGVAISHHDKVAMALASMKAVSPELYGTMVAGIERGRRFSFGTLRACFRAVAR